MKIIDGQLLRYLRMHANSNQTDIIIYMNTTLHLPLNKELKSKAEYIAKEKGYSSLQEVLRVFIVQFTNEEVKPAFINTNKIVQLTSDQEAYLAKREQETQKAVSSGESYAVNSVDEMMKILEK